MNYNFLMNGEWRHLQLFYLSIIGNMNNMCRMCKRFGSSWVFCFERTHYALPLYSIPRMRRDWKQEPLALSLSSQVDCTDAGLPVWFATPQLAATVRSEKRIVEAKIMNKCYDCSFRHINYPRSESLGPPFSHSLF